MSQLLPVCESALKVRVFTRQQSQYEYGMVSHAMCAAMKRILRDFDKLVAQMEHLYSQQNLSLQKMVHSTIIALARVHAYFDIFGKVFLLQPSKVTLYQLEQLCARLSGLTGGRLLDVLHGVLLEQGDRRAREMHSHLLDEAYKPFLTILQQWIERCSNCCLNFLLYNDSIWYNSEESCWTLIRNSWCWRMLLFPKKLSKKTSTVFTAENLNTS